MALSIETLDMPPWVPSLARALQDAPGAQVLWSADGSGASYLACDPVDQAFGLDPEPALPLNPGLPWGAEIPRWIGVLPYESRRHLERARGPERDERPKPHLVQASWLRYPAVIRVEGGRVHLIAESSQAARGLKLRLTEGLAKARDRISVGLSRILDEADSEHAHKQRVRRALKLIREGELYQISLARRFSFQVSGLGVELVIAAAQTGGAPYACALQFDGCQIVGFSPELFLRVNPLGELTTIPIKGTRPRGGSPEQDAALIVELDEDPKERAELAMIIDVERNDLGKIAQTGSVRLVEGPRVVSHPTIHHREAVLRAALKPGLSREAVLEAMLPSGSVTGAPKIRSMDAIAELESVRRGLYTGAYGHLTQAGGLELAMAIRTMTIRDGVGHYYTGGGIVVDSDPERELLETEWKAEQFSRMARARPE